MIKMFNERSIKNIEGIEDRRHVDIIISDGATHYRLGVGGLPLFGDLQIILDAREVELWTVAQEKDTQLTAKEVRRLLFNSKSGGGWNQEEFQDAVFEKDAGDPTKWDNLKIRRDLILGEWPTS